MCVGYASWAIAKETNPNATVKVDVAVDQIEEVDVSLFSFGTAQDGDKLQYYYSSDGAIGGLVNDGEIGDTGTAVFRIAFDMGTFVNSFLWNSLDLTLTLSYASNITSLGLLNTNTKATLTATKTVVKNESSSTTPLSNPPTLNLKSASSSSVIYSTSLTRTSDYSRLNMAITYTFNLESGKGLAQAKALKALGVNDNVFSIKVSASKGSGS